MVASIAKDVLKKENELLDDLASRTAAFAQDLPGLQAEIVNDWAAFFRGWQKVNAELISRADSATDQELKAEIKRLETMRNSIAGDDAGAAYWKQSFDEDLEIANRLL